MSKDRGHGPDIRVLVNEVDPSIRELLDVYLTADGFVPVLVDSPEDVLPRIQAESEPIDVLITNVVMSIGDGLKLAKTCQELRPGLKVIFTSSESPVELLAERGLMIPGNQFLRKPFDARALTRKIAEVMTS